MRSAVQNNFVFFFTRQEDSLPLGRQDCKKMEGQGTSQRKKPILKQKASTNHTKRLPNQINTEQNENYETNRIKTEPEKLKDVTNKYKKLHNK